MISADLQEELQDEIHKSCVDCGVDRIIAYWDYELEYYIYLDESDICTQCQAKQTSV